MIELDSVTIALRGREILSRCSARLESGTVTHLAGNNGSGKTTLIRAIAGIQRYSGSIRFDGAEAARVRAGLYVCFDDAPVFPYLSGYENIRMLIGRPIAKSVIANAAPVLADHGLLQVQARKLSHGQRKRLHLVAALVSGARYLILDEALNGVDAPTALEVGTALAGLAPKSTVLITGHHTDTYDHLASRRLVLADGTITEIPGDAATASSERASA